MEPMMTALKLTQIGNSVGVILPKDLLSKLKLEKGDTVFVTEAANGAEALKAIKGDKPDLVLSDWNMPEMNGIELLRALKSENVAVQFGFITSEGTADMQGMAKDAGALFLITKPFTVETFQVALRPVLS
jgi:two-component system chemotaxis response regulator CheY